MYIVKLLLEAEIDLTDACAWYEKKRPGLGAEFLDEFDRVVGIIKNNPLQFAINFSGKYRFALLKRFPYSLAYRIDEDGFIVVASVFHQHRNPSGF